VVAERCDAWLSMLAKAAGLFASSAKALGLAASADITAWFDAKAANPGSLASARKVGSFTITWKASVCISSGTAVSPSVTSASVTCADT